MNGSISVCLRGSVCPWIREFIIIIIIFISIITIKWSYYYIITLYYYVTLYYYIVLYYIILLCCVIWHYIMILLPYITILLLYHNCNYIHYCYYSQNNWLSIIIVVIIYIIKFSSYSCFYALDCYPCSHGWIFKHNSHWFAFLVLPPWGMGKWFLPRFLSCTKMCCIIVFLLGTLWTHLCIPPPHTLTCITAIHTYKHACMHTCAYALTYYRLINIL